MSIPELLFLVASNVECLKIGNASASRDTQRLSYAAFQAGQLVDMRPYIELIVAGVAPGVEASEKARQLAGANDPKAVRRLGRGFLRRRAAMIAGVDYFYDSAQAASAP